MIVVEVRDMDFKSVLTGSVEDLSIHQNLRDWSWDAEMSEEGEENARPAIILVCPVRISIRQGSELVMSQM